MPQLLLSVNEFVNEARRDIRTLRRKRDEDSPLIRRKVVPCMDTEYAMRSCLVRNLFCRKKNIQKIENFATVVTWSTWRDDAF